MTRIQEDIIDGFDPCFTIINWAYQRDINRDFVELYAEYKDTIRKYIIYPDGETRMTQYSKNPSETLLCKYSMEEHDWAVTEFTSNEEETGDVPFDVVVDKMIEDEMITDNGIVWRKETEDKNKLKIEKEFKKMAKCDFSRIAKEVNRENFKEWVEANAEDLVDYAECAFEEAYKAYIEDNADDYETMAHEAIDNIVDNLWMSDYSSDLDDDPCEVIEEVIM